MNLINLFEAFILNLHLILISIVFIYVIKEIIKDIIIRYHLPSGPLGLPIFGYLPFLGNDVHKDLTNLGTKYGNLGTKHIVILNDLDAIKNAFLKDSFLGRPKDNAFSVVGGSKSFPDESGNVWSEHRNFAISLLHELGFKKGNTEESIKNEISYLIKEIDKSNGEPINAHNILTPSVSNNICSLMFGHRMDYDDPIRILLDRSLDFVSKLFSQTGFFSVYPLWFCKLCMRLGITENLKQFSKLAYLFSSEIAKHRETLDANNIRDYIDGYIIEMDEKKKKGQNTSIKENMLLANVRAFFGAGSETVRTSVEWLLILIANDEQFQERVYKEINNVIGRERTPEWSDRFNMPFTQSFIHEMFRWITIIPLNIFRCATEDASVLGHFIPKDTPVMANFWAVNHDPEIWKNPETFNPKRFMNEKETDFIHNDSVMIFSMGKKSCAGESLARLEIFLYFTTLLQRYHIIKDKTFTCEQRFGLTLQPKDDVILRFKLRD